MGRDEQLSLFGEPEPPSNSRTVGAAVVPEDVQAVAGALPGNIRLGTSSWSFPGWEGLVYDREASKAHLARRGLGAYAKHPLLRTVGIDRTFYAPIPASEFAAYAESVPEDFRFLVKASSECTMPLLRDGSGRLAEPNPRYLDPVWASDEVVGPFVEGLGERAGPLVFQFSPLGRRRTVDPARFAGELGEFLADLPPGPLYAVELRDRAVFGDAYLEALHATGSHHCFNVHPRMPTLDQQWRAAQKTRGGPIVVRWMLHAGLQYEQAVERFEPFSELVDEDPESRETLAELCVAEAVRVPQIVIVANNKAEGSAPLTIGKLARSIARRLADSG